MPNAKPGLKQHPLLDKLASAVSGAPGQAAGAGAAPPPTGVRAISGYLAKGTQEGQWRLYLTADFNEYLTINEKDIVASELLATDADPVAPHVVWVKADANLQHTTVQSKQVQAQFLSGSLASQFDASVQGTPAGQRFAPRLRQSTAQATSCAYGDCGTSDNCNVSVGCPGYSGNPCRG